MSLLKFASITAEELRDLLDFSTLDELYEWTGPLRYTQLVRATTSGYGLGDHGASWARVRELVLAARAVEKLDGAVADLAEGARAKCLCEMAGVPFGDGYVTWKWNAWGSMIQLGKPPR